MNSVVLIGRLTRDPELSYTPSTQTAVAHFTIAVDRPRRNGEDAGADFIRVTVFGRQAETCDRYLAKGRQVAVLGRIQTGSYKNREGVTVYTTDVVADRVEFLGGNQGQGGGSSQNNYGSQSRDNSYGGSQNSGFGGQDEFGGSSVGDFGGSQSSAFDGFGDLPDSFQAAEDDIPF